MIENEKENRKKVERALIVGIASNNEELANIHEHLDELEDLTQTLGIEVLERCVVKLPEISSQYYVGNGKAQEIVTRFQQLEADVLIFDNELSPSQQRNWERLSKGCVIDRHEVILDIFGERACTKEAVLQIELARLQYYLPRLTRAWTHLSRQRGGAKGTRGEGEKQIEADRRMVKQRISNLEKELVAVQRQRITQRKSRQRNIIPKAAIVGYTNAGKSSLLNYLTSANVLAEDKLFATLDPTTRKVILPDNQPLLLTDTVGFVRKLPHALVDAFKSTLEEATYADFLILVLDVHSPQIEEHWETTMQVLKELEAADKEIIVVFNKLDLAQDELLLIRARSLFKDGIFLSTKTGEGIEDLKDKLISFSSRFNNLIQVHIPPNRSDLVALAYNAGNVLEANYDEHGNMDMIFAINLSLQKKYMDYIKK